MLPVPTIDTTIMGAAVLDTTESKDEVKVGVEAQVACGLAKAVSG